MARDGLPAIGSFSLVKDLVRDYAELSVVQDYEKKKHDLDSLRAFPSTRKCKQSMNKTQDGSSYRSHSMNNWADESKNNRMHMFRGKGIREETGFDSGRFQTSVKGWLEGYQTVREKFQQQESEGMGRMNSSVGKALFNLKRTMPAPTKQDANAWIKQRFGSQKPRGNPLSMSNRTSPRRNNQYMM